MAAKNIWFITIGCLIMGLNIKTLFCNDCHDLTMLCVNTSNTAIITVIEVDYRYIIHKIRKSAAIHLLKKIS